MYSMSCVSSSSSKWSRMDDKLFERALVLFPEDTPDKWEKIARQVPGKSWTEVKKHYEDLVHDLVEIDSGRVGLPSYGDELEFDPSRLGGASGESGMSQLCFGIKGKERESERRKGIPWTEEEHRLFLIGLQRYGKGDWRSISRNAVVSRTPTQVASHAQKYFLRLNSVKKEKKRCSIHDITSANATTSSAQTGQENSVMDPSGLELLESSILFQHQGSSYSSAYQQIGFPM